MTTCNFVVNEVAFGIKRFVGLCYVVVLFFIGCYIFIFICNSRFVAALINNSVRGLDKAVFIYSCEACK